MRLTSPRPTAGSDNFPVLLGHSPACIVDYVMLMTEGIAIAKHEAAVPLRVLKQRCTHEAWSTAHTQEDSSRNTNTGKHATSRDAMYTVVDRSQMRQASGDRWLFRESGGAVRIKVCTA